MTMGIFVEFNVVNRTPFDDAKLLLAAIDVGNDDDDGDVDDVVGDGKCMMENKNSIFVLSAYRMNYSILSLCRLCAF
jgi:hypothetical protein